MDIKELLLPGKYIILPDDYFNYYLNKTNEFVKAISESKKQSVDYYRDRRAAVKPMKDIAVGKMGEVYAAYYVHKCLGYGFVEPDFNIYGSRNKDWSEDLNTGFHVKTCDLQTKKFVGQPSWTFQFNNQNGSFGRDMLFDSEGKDVIIFVYIDSYDKNEAVILIVSPWKDIAPFLKDPLKKSLRNIKRCIYYNDFIGKRNA